MAVGGCGSSGSCGPSISEQYAAARREEKVAQTQFTDAFTHEPVEKPRIPANAATKVQGVIDIEGGKVNILV